MHNISMNTTAGWSVGHIVCVMLLIVLTVTPIESSSRPLLSVSNSILDSDGFDGGSRELYQVQGFGYGDYGNWDPAPSFGGRSNYSPVPHPVT